MRRRGGAVREAARRQRQEPARGPATLEDLEAVRDELAGLDDRRRRLVGRRDVIVQELRAAGVTWPALEAASGASRPALLKRGARGLL